MASEGEPSFGPGALPRPRVLIVEPSAAIAGLLGRALAQDGYAASEAVVTGRDALRAVEAGRADVLLIEADLPDMPGQEVADRAAVRGVPAVLLTGNGALIHAFEAEGRPHLRKPFALDDLLRALATASDRTRGA